MKSDDIPIQTSPMFFKMGDSMPRLNSCGAQAVILILLEFVTSPERPIIHVAPRLRFLQKLSREENSIVTLEP
jgi:hypothetical protein